MTTENIFTPHELKTVEIDVEKKIFKINGMDMGKGCSDLNINFNCNGSRIKVEAKNIIEFSSYDRRGDLLDHNTVTKS